MQALYRLQVGTRVMTHVATRAEYFCDLTFAPDSETCMVLWYDPSDSDRHFFEVYSQAGQQVSHFEEPGIACLKYDEPSVAYLMGGRVAIAHPHKFIVRHLRSRDKLASRRPVQAEHAWPGVVLAGLGCAGVVAEDRAGSRLAFCAARTSVVYLYEPATLKVLGSVAAAAAFVPAPGRGRSAQLVWGVHGWLLVTDHTILKQVAAQDLHVLRHQEGTGLYEEVLFCKRQPRGLSAASPDGALVCSYDRAASTIEIHDTRFGLPLCKQALPALPDTPQGEQLELLVDI